MFILLSFHLFYYTFYIESNEDFDPISHQKLMNNFYMKLRKSYFLEAVVIARISGYQSRPFVSVPA